MNELTDFNEPIVVRLFHKEELVDLYDIIYEYDYKIIPGTNGNADSWSSFRPFTDYLLYPNKTWTVTYDGDKYTRYDLNSLKAKIKWNKKIVHFFDNWPTID